MILPGWHLSPNRHRATHPVNLVFFGDASAADVAFHLQHSVAERWHPTVFSHRMYAYIDDTAHGGARGWKPPDADLSLGPPIGGSRRHIRVYECFVPGRHADGQREFGRWSLAAVHLEHFAVSAGHVIDDWKEPQEFVERQFTGEPFVGDIFALQVGTSGVLQGHAFDGYVTFIELLPWPGT